MHDTALTQFRDISHLVTLIMICLYSEKYNYLLLQNGGWHSAIRRGEKKALDNVLLEVQRLWPPLVGGRRITCQVGDKFTHYTYCKLYK